LQIALALRTLLGSRMSTLLLKARLNLLQSIRGGEFDVGDVLPAAHELASRMRCSPATMEKALLKLANDGVVRRVKRKGTIVARRPAIGRAGLVLTDDAHFNGLFAEPIYAELKRSGFDVEMIPWAGDSDHLADDCIRLRKQSAAEFLVMLQPPMWGDESYAHLQKTIESFPHRVGVALNSKRNDPSAHVVSFDHQQSAFDVVQHLLSLGHRTVAVADALDNWSYISETAQACRRLLEIAGAKYVRAPYFGLDAESATALVKREGVTAFWTLHDHDALIGMAELGRRGCRVPEDVSIVGRNDTPWSREGATTLSSVSLNPPAVAKAVADVMSKFAAGDESPRGGFTLVRPSLVARGSSQPVRGM
jgi:DNA-binding LacI/PurR family transcriptional regulator